MKPKPISSMQRPIAAGSRSIFAPSASSTSAEPERPVAERLPCLATTQPALAAISAAVVETLKVRAAAAGAGGVEQILVVVAHDGRAAPASSARARPAPRTVSPLTRSAIRKPAIWTSEASPDMISARTAAASSSLRS